MALSELAASLSLSAVLAGLEEGTPDGPQACCLFIGTAASRSRRICQYLLDRLPASSLPCLRSDAGDARDHARDHAGGGSTTASNAHDAHDSTTCPIAVVGHDGVTPPSADLVALLQRADSLAIVVAAPAGVDVEAVTERTVRRIIDNMGQSDDALSPRRWTVVVMEHQSASPLTSIGAGAGTTTDAAPVAASSSTSTSQALAGTHEWAWALRSFSSASPEAHRPTAHLGDSEGAANDRALLDEAPGRRVAMRVASHTTAGGRVLVFDSATHSEATDLASQSVVAPHNESGPTRTIDMTGDGDGGPAARLVEGILGHYECPQSGVGRIPPPASGTARTDDPMVGLSTERGRLPLVSMPLNLAMILLRLARYDPMVTARLRPVLEKKVVVASRLCGPDQVPALEDTYAELSRILEWNYGSCDDNGGSGRGGRGRHLQCGPRTRFAKAGAKAQHSPEKLTIAMVMINTCGSGHAVFLTARALSSALLRAIGGISILNDVHKCR